MRLMNFSRNLAIILLTATFLGLLIGCSTTPSDEPTLPPDTEAPTMVPTDLPTSEPEPTSIPEDAAAPDSPAPEMPETGMAHSAKERNLVPNISETELQELAAGNSAFAIDLYQALRGGNDNLFFSPYSISLALAMTYGGARSETAQQMAETLQFTLPDEAVHAGFNALDLELASRNNEGNEMMPGFKLNIANSAWAQYDRPFEQAYLDLLAENYDTGLYLTDYVGDPEGSREAINDWVSNETAGKIEDLIPPGAVDSLTRLVLANAIYFNADWQSPFAEDLTDEDPFFLLDGSRKNVSMMSTTDPESFGYAAGEGFQAVELPYKGGQLSMVILLPDAGKYEMVESNLNADQLTELLGKMEIKQIELQMPKFEFESEMGLSDVLRQLGMQAAFDPQAADFSGIDGTRDLFISDVIHKAFVKVDEKGTEAAAATGVVIGLTSMPVTDLQLTIDHPFIFLIQDKTTGTIIFLGRVLDPTQ